jgi:two-component system phosphate regulon response regulator PhoB
LASQFANDGTATAVVIGVPRNRRKVLVVDDDRAAANLLERLLEGEGFDVEIAVTSLGAKEAADIFEPDAVLLDLVLNGEDTFDMLVELRRNQDVPVILIGDEGGNELDRLVGLRMGADDCVTKPFSYAELVARLRAVLRRTLPRNPTIDGPVLGRLKLDTVAREVHVDGVLIETTAREFDLLAFLAQYPRQVFSRAQLLDRVWGSSDDWQDPATVTEYVRRLRSKLGLTADDAGWISTVRGIGYRIEPCGTQIETSVAAV